MIRAERTTGLRDFYNGVGQHWRLHFGGAPGELHFDINSAAREVVLGYVHQFSSDDLSAEVFSLFIRRTLGNSQHPSHFTAALLRIDQIANCDNFESALNDP